MLWRGDKYYNTVPSKLGHVGGERRRESAWWLPTKMTCWGRLEAGVGHDMGQSGKAIRRSLVMKMVLQIDPEGWMDFWEAEVRAGMAES